VVHSELLFVIPLMANKSKLQPRRKYGAEGEASVLVDWLNAADVKHRSLRRVLTVREFLRKLELHAQQWRSFSAKEKASLKAAQLWQDAYMMFDQLNQLLERYRMTPVLEPQLGGANINWRAPRTRGFVATIHSYLAPAREVDEPEAIQRILNLSRTPYLSYLRQCDHCKRWLYAIRSDQRFCTGKNCKQKHSQTGPSFKEDRRKYMRKYRDTLRQMSGIRSLEKRRQQKRRAKQTA
jgi:hypothetical protein